MKTIDLIKNTFESEYFPIGQNSRMKISFLTPNLKSIEIRLKEVPSGKEMNSPMEIIHNKIINVHEYNYMKIYFESSDTDRQIQLFFDNEII